MSGHTPSGPWQIDRDHTHGKLPLTICTGSMSTGMDWQMIASVYTEDAARLIAAAPDLLKALTDIMREYRHVMGDDTAEITAAFAAISRAEAPDTGADHE